MAKRVTGYGLQWEPNMDLCLMKMKIYISRKRAIFVRYQFLKELQKRFERKSISTDGARRYKEAC
jgi:hypothetical protein